MGSSQQPHTRKKPKKPGRYAAGRGAAKRKRAARYKNDNSSSPGGGAKRSRKVQTKEQKIEHMIKKKKLQLQKDSKERERKRAALEKEAKEEALSRDYKVTVAGASVEANKPQTTKARKQQAAAPKPKSKPEINQETQRDLDTLARLEKLGL